MIGILIISHCDVGKELLNAAKLILGRLESANAISITQTTESEELLKTISKEIQALDQGKGVLVLTDMFGGTPSNLSFSFLKEERVEVLTGVNLPMLIKLVNLRQESATLELLKEKLCFYGREKIVAASDLLNQRLAQKG